MDIASSYRVITLVRHSLTSQTARINNHLDLRTKRRQRTHHKRNQSFLSTRLLLLHVSNMLMHSDNQDCRNRHDWNMSISLIPSYTQQYVLDNDSFSIHVYWEHFHSVSRRGCRQLGSILDTSHFWQSAQILVWCEYCWLLFSDVLAFPFSEQLILRLLFETNSQDLWLHWQLECWSFASRVYANRAYKHRWCQHTFQEQTRWQFLQNPLQHVSKLAFNAEYVLVGFIPITKVSILLIRIPLMIVTLQDNQHILTKCINYSQESDAKHCSHSKLLGQGQVEVPDNRKRK